MSVSSKQRTRPRSTRSPKLGQCQHLLRKSHRRQNILGRIRSTGAHAEQNGLMLSRTGNPSKNTGTHNGDYNQWRHANKRGSTRKRSRPGARNRHVINGIFSCAKISSLLPDANSATNVCLDTLRLMGSRIKSRRKSGGKRTVALLKETIQLSCVPRLPSEKAFFCGSLENWDLIIPSSSPKAYGRGRLQGLLAENTLVIKNLEQKKLV